LCSFELTLQNFGAAAHFFGGATIGSSAYLQCAGSSELVPCTLAAVATPPWDIAREFVDDSTQTAHFVSHHAPFYSVLRISRPLAACNLSSIAPRLGSSIVATGYGMLPAGCSRLRVLGFCLFSFF
jgi:hypothetical protein